MKIACFLSLPLLLLLAQAAFCASGARSWIIYTGHLSATPGSKGESRRAREEKEGEHMSQAPSPAAAAVVVTTPAPADQGFSITNLQSWTMLHWAVGVLGVVVLVLLSCLIYVSRRSGSSGPVAVSQEFRGREESVPMLLGSCPHEKRMQMLSRYV